MKFVFHVSPNLQGPSTTSQIMRDLTIGLGVIYICSLIYYALSFGFNYALQIIILLACSLITCLVCEAVYAKFTKQDIKDFILHSYGWVTCMILVMMCQISISPYAIIVATFFAIAAARLMFGGFGNNIYNPAAVGRAVIFAAFAGATTNLVTMGTPTTFIATSFRWLPGSAEALDSFLAPYGGLLSLIIGTYPGAIGETFALPIVIVGIILAIRKVIDWRVPVVYLCSIALFTAAIALLSGLGSWNGIPAFLWYPLIHLLLGGACFGAFFMLTDPVTMPTAASGRVIFAIFAAVITVLIRMKGNLPEGVLYSILIMNTFSPMIEMALDGVQTKQRKKAIILSLCGLILGFAISFYASETLYPVRSTQTLSQAQVIEGEVTL